ncbi:hemolysin family protein [Myxococcota bacterium]|nr:hemolysin family protein [Myxococcota bacterium]
MIAVAVVALLLLANGLFVAAELSLVAVPRAKLERLVAEGHVRARRVAALLDDPKRQDRYIATVQLCITFTSLGLGMYGEHELAGVLERWIASWPLPAGLAAHGIASVVALVVLTTLHIVLGEMVPKAIALVRAERTIVRLVSLMRVVQALTYPISVTLNALGNAILALGGISRSRGSEHLHTPEELRFIVRESQQRGALRTEAASLVEELLLFDERTAREVMVPRVRVDALELGVSFEELARTIDEAPRTRYPVYEGDVDHMLGCVHLKTILPRLAEGRTFTAEDVRPIPFVPETMSLDQVLRAMRERHTQMAIVMDEHGGTSGVLTISDLFAEVTGHIEASPAESLDLERPETFEVAGTVRLDEAGRLFGLDVEHEDVDTVSGLVLAELGRPPRRGDAVEWRGLAFEVLDTVGHGVARCRVSLRSRSEAAPADIPAAPEGS